MAKHFNGDRSGRDALIALRDHFQDLDDRMTKLRDESNYGVTAADDLCNRQHIINRVAVDAKTRTLGFGPFRSNCITDLESTGTAKLWNTIMQFQKSILPAGKRALKEAKLGWRSVWPHSNFTYEEDINQCRLAHAVAYRVNGTWSVLGSVTDSPPNIRKENFQRRYIEEYLMPGKEARARVGNLKINLPEIRNENVIVTDSTTSMSTWGGMPASSIFSEVAPLERNPGIAAALARGRRWFQQAEDSRAVSNIAIMVLSACLSLVPIAGVRGRVDLRHDTLHHRHGLHGMSAAVHQGHRADRAVREDPDGNEKLDLRHGDGHRYINRGDLGGAMQRTQVAARTRRGLQQRGRRCDAHRRRAGVGRASQAEAREGG